MHRHDLVADASLDMVGRHADDLPAAAALLQPGDRVNIGASGVEGLDIERTTAAAVAGYGLTPVPHIAARRIPSQHELERMLRGLQADGTSRTLLMLGGDPATPVGPFDGALALLRAVHLPDYGVEAAGISGYPEGHTAIPDGILWAALRGKLSELDAQGVRAEITTQISIGVDPVLRWLRALRQEGITAPVLVGVCGPIEPARLLWFAQRLGVASDPVTMSRYGVDSADQPGVIGPERFAAELADRLEPGDVGLHLFSLGGLREAAQWIRDARES